METKIFKFFNENLELGEDYLLAKNNKLLSEKASRMFEISLFWTKFQSAVSGRGPGYLICLTDGDKLLAATSLIKVNVNKWLNWLWSPTGLIIIQEEKHINKDKAVEVMIDECKKIAREEKSFMIRFENKQNSIDGNKYELKAIYERYVPGDTLLIDLRKSQEDILKEMKPKGRYNVKLAEKKGVKVYETDMKEVNKFYELIKETSDRDKFGVHGLTYFERLLALGTNDGSSKLYFVEYEGEKIAGAICVYFGDHCVYLFGASSSKHRNVMAPYLLQYKMMMDAKADGYKYYDFYGVAPAGMKNHQLSGVTEFKEKFGGFRVEYPSAQVLITGGARYIMYALAKKILKS